MHNFKPISYFFPKTLYLKILHSVCIMIGWVRIGGYVTSRENKSTSKKFNFSSVPIPTIINGQ